MATKKSFLEMHNAVGGSYSSPERVQQEQERNQKRQEKTAEINRQAVTQPKQTTQKAVTSTGNQKKSTAPSGALPGIGSLALTGEKNLPGSIQWAAGGASAKIPAKRAATPGVVQDINQLLFSAADRKAPERRQKQIGELEQSISALQEQVKPLNERAEYAYGFDNNGNPTQEELRRQQMNQQIKEQQRQLDSLNQQERLYQRQQSGYDMVASAAKDPDFASKSGYVSTKRGDGFLDRFGSEMAMGYDDLLYEYINNQEEGIRDQIRRQKPNFGGGYDLMNDNEVALYNYYYATGGKEAAQKYLNSIEDTVNQRKGEQLFQGIGGRTPEQNAQVSQEIAELSKQLQPLPDGVTTDEDTQQQETRQRLGELHAQNRDKTIRELLFGIGAGLDQFGEGVEGAIRAVRGEDSYQAPSARQYASGLIRQDLGETGAKLPEWMGGSSIGQVGYDAVTNIAHMAPSILASGAANALVPGSGAYVANALVAASSGGSAYQDAINQGYSTNQARNYAAVMGASEAAMQYALGGIEAFGGKISGNIVEKAVEGIGNGVAKAALETGLNMASEGMEEGIQEALEPVFTRAFLGKEENVDWSQVAYSAVLGALTAGLMEGPKNFTDARNSAKAETPTQAPAQQTGTDTATQQATGTPLQGEAADPRHVAAQQEQAARTQAEAQPTAAQDTNPSASLLDGVDIPQDTAQEQTGPNPVADMLAPIQNPQQSTVDTAPAPKYNGSAITVPGAAVGRSDVTYTADNKPISFQYAVVPAESLVTSNDQFGNVNSAYPAELQPRDRTRAASQSQINNISRNLNPALLAESPTAQNGAPIIRGDGVVIGGNGRASAIAQAYVAGRGADYQQFITQKAAELGIDPATIPANPVLVRVTNGVNNYTELANSLNAATTASYSATETAKIDASRIGDIIGHLSISENGGVNTAENREFIREFVSRVVPESERGDVMQANGQLSQAGERRIQNALFAYAYGDTALVERLAESTDNNAKNITNAMLSAAGKVATLQAEIERGEVQDLGVQQAITNAANLYLDAKSGKHTVEDAAGQLVLGEDGPESQYDGLTVNLAKFMESNSRSGLQIRTFIDILADVNMNMPAETASQVSLFGTGGQQNQEGLYNEAVAAYDQQRDGKGRIPEKSDFSQYRQYSPGELAAGLDGSRTEGNPGSTLSYGGSTQPVSAAVPGGQRGVTDQTPGIKGTGAAEANFTQKPAYNATLSAENAQPDRASDVRPMELPKTDIEGNPVSAVTGNAYGSKITSDELASLMEEPTARGDFSYARISNDQATQKAMDTIAAAGDWESAYNQWAKDVGAGKAGAEMAARGALFLNHFAKEGNKTQWLNTLADMQDLGTNTAQGLQAMRLIRELAPQDKVRFVEMATKRLGQQMGVDFQVDQSLYDAYNNATTDEARNAALDDIQQNIADQIPSTALDKWNALRYTNMLGNLKTNVRNIAGNVGAGAMYRVKDQIAATMEDVLHAATGGEFEKTKSHTVSRELLDACKKDFSNVSGIVSDGGKYGSRDGFSDQFVQGAMDKRRIFKSDNKILNAAMAPMEAYRKGTNWMMNNQYFGDEAFGKAAYARSLAGYLKAHGVTDTDLSKVDASLMDKARAYAVQEAQEATFHDNSALARAFSNVKRDMGVIGEGIAPFTKTPANVLTRAYEFSPLGLIDTTAKAVTAAKGEGNVTGTDVINSLSKTLTGTAIFALGAWLKHQGFLTGGPDDDDEKDAFDKLNGDQNYAIRFTVGGKTYNYTFDWLTPAAMPLFMGAQLMDILDKGIKNITFADLENVFTSIADPMLQMSMLQSLNDSLDNIKYTDNNLGQFFINAAVSYLTQGLSNTLVGQIERSTEKNRMTTYVDKNSQLPAWMQRQIGSLSQKVPGWDYQQTEYRNAYGETEENEGGLLYNLLSPGYISEEKSNALSQELYRLNDAGVDGNVFPDTPDTTLDYTDSEGNRHEDYHLSAGEADRLKEVTGKTATNILSDMIETDLYKAMSDQQKADAVRKVYDYARELGRTEAIDGYQGMDTWMETAAENPTKAILDRVVKAGFDDAFDSLTHAWEYDKDPASAVSALEDAYSVYSGMGPKERKEFKENTGGKVGYLLDAKDAGIDGKTFTELYKTYSDIDAQDSDASTKARNWAYYLNKEKAAGNITTAQEAKLKDSMAYYNIFPADAGKFNGLTEAGLSADTAQKVVKLMDGITGTGKDGHVRDIDKYTAIAGSGLSAKDKETALLEYAPDAMDDKYNYAKKNMTKNGKGITIDDFVKAYQVTDEYSKKKEQTDAWQAMGYTKTEAENLYKLYKGKFT